MQVNKVNAHEVQQQVKANQLEGYKNAIDQQRQQQQAHESFQHSGIRWNVIRSKDNKKVDFNPLLEPDHVSISSIRRFDKTVTATVSAHKLGYKIGLEEKKELLIERYIKNFLQSKSHNYIISKFAQLKTAFLGQLLSNIGVTIPELQKMQKKALAQAQEENELLFEENEYNFEMICVLGGSAKKIKKELRIMNEIKTQLTTQMDKLGKPGYYSSMKELEIKLKVCERIRDDFMKEKTFLEYQRDYYYNDTAKVKTREKIVFSDVYSS